MGYVVVVYLANTRKILSQHYVTLCMTYFWKVFYCLLMAAFKSTMASCIMGDKLVW